MNDTYKRMDVSKKYPVDVHAFRKLPIILEEIQKLMSMMQDEWQFCLGLYLHPGGRPLFNPGCRCRSRNDWACSCIQCPVTTSHPSIHPSIHPSTNHASIPSLPFHDPQSSTPSSHFSQKRDGFDRLAAHEGTSQEGARLLALHLQCTWSLPLTSKPCAPNY
jgi:hypothetical protein